MIYAFDDLIILKDDTFVKIKYRPVSILNSHSKIYENIIHCQLSKFWIVFLTIT